MLRCHPGFRLVALAEPPTPTRDWLHSGGVLGSGMFDFHVLVTEAGAAVDGGGSALAVVQQSCPQLPPRSIRALGKFMGLMHSGETSTQVRSQQNGDHTNKLTEPPSVVGA